MNVRNLLTGLLFVFSELLIYSQPNIISVSVRSGSDSVILKWAKPLKTLTSKEIVKYQISSCKLVKISGVYSVQQDGIITVYVLDTSKTDFTFKFPLVNQSPFKFSIAECYDISCYGTSNFAINPHRTIYLTSVWDSCMSKINLHWTKYEGWRNQLKEYRIFSEINGISNWEGTIRDTTDTTFNFTAKANKNYTVYVVAINKDTTISSRSNETEIKTQIAEPPKFILAKGTVYRNQEIDLAFDLDTASRINHYQLFASDNPLNEFTKIKDFYGYAGRPELTFTNIISGNPKPSYYFLRAINNCGLILDSSNLTTAIVPIISVKDNVINLQWNLYEHWPHGIIEYDIYRLIDGKHKSTTSNYIQDDLQSLVGQNFSGNICYRVDASTTYDGVNKPLFARSAEVCIDLTENIFIPNAFLPNSTNEYDNTFKPFFAFQPQIFTMLVYNRNGFKIFETKDPQKGWDGTINGKKAPEGTYIFFIRFSSQNGKVIEKRGNFSVIYSKAE